MPSAREPRGRCAKNLRRVTQGQQGASLEPPSLAFGAFQGSLLSAMLTSTSPGGIVPAQPAPPPAGTSLATHFFLRAAIQRWGDTSGGAGRFYNIEPWGRGEANLRASPCWGM